MDKTTLTVLVDNQAGFGCVAEHGFALWIEHGDQHILLDTGQGTALEGNARTLGVDLGLTDALVLSHGHYDHTGAVPLVLGAAPGSLRSLPPRSDRAALQHQRRGSAGHPHASALHAGPGGPSRRTLALDRRVP
jgi:metal-dependent hydrolase (beta-lactamase superfamily II)